MTDSFEIEKYAIISSLNERNVYVKVVDRILFMCYEASVDSKELRLPIELANTYQLMTKCFKREVGYNVLYNDKIVWVQSIRKYASPIFE